MRLCLPARINSTLHPVPSPLPRGCEARCVPVRGIVRRTRIAYTIRRRRVSRALRNTRARTRAEKTTRREHLALTEANGERKKKRDEHPRKGLYYAAKYRVELQLRETSSVSRANAS